MLKDEVQKFLKENGIHLKKSLGQNFLINEEVLQKIVESADIKENDHIIEIGPGIGVLTRELLQKTQNVTAIELDETLIPLLEKFVNKQHVILSPSKDDMVRRAHHDTFKIINENALTVELPKTEYKIVANIPYHITSPLLRHAFTESTPPKFLTLLIQKEVALKICTKDDASRLTILVGLFGTPTLITTVPPTSFIPPPKVDSAVLHIESFEKPKADPETIERVFTLTKTAFGQRRKMLRNTVDVELLKKSDIAPDRRPQTLSIEEWITLAKNVE
jgi:16S rRNA (adenine1518-N6/adenine1519-N6)-dimethyltransferase